MLYRYMHTKGVSSRVQSWARNIFFWRSVMEYFLIARWRDCIDLLEQYDVVGGSVRLTLPGLRQWVRVAQEPEVHLPSGITLQAL